MMIFGDPDEDRDETSWYVENLDDNMDENLDENRDETGMKPPGPLQSKLCLGEKMQAKNNIFFMVVGTLY